VADVSTEAGREVLRNEVDTRFGGKLDILINNVGTNIRKKTAEYTVEDYDFIMKTNLQSVFELTKLFYPYLKRPSENPWEKSFSHDEIIRKESSSLPRPDHTQVSADNEVGKHLVHPGMEV
jgi:NAD(P)-dependent dehydrogenase (short-subunit alcohol dehydrogenase family)